MQDSPPAVRRRVGNRVRELRSLRGLSQEQLAEKSGFSSKHVSLLELGKTNAGINTLAKIARSLTVDIQALFERPGSRRTIAFVTARELDAFTAAGRAADRLRRSLTAGRKRRR
jgi:transcriptional regulator with XRE-family HTH domain